MIKACLLIVFNHRYDKNIAVLERLYSGRFSHIYFLVPFYNGSHPRVIPVYESSHFFQSFFAQAFSRFVKEEFTHYIFTGDDCILNPILNETNFPEQTGMPADADFIPGIFPFHGIEGNKPWWHTFKGIDFFNNRKGAEIGQELPSREEAVRRFAEHGIEIRPVSKTNIFGTGTPPGQSWWKYQLFKNYHYLIKWKKYKQRGRIELPYPVAGSYADVLIITRASIADFSRYCGLLAAAGLFVEIAIPVALLLSAKKIVQEKDLRLKGRALWSVADMEEVERRYGKSLSALIAGFPQEQLFYHPVKLSKWTNDL